jgi:homoserine O-acetyltransferase
VPFGRVVEGMDTADTLYSDYGEAAGGGIRGGKQGTQFEGGNEFLKKNFARLDLIKTTTVIAAETERWGETI